MTDISYRPATAADLQPVEQLLIDADLPTAALATQFPAQYRVAEARGRITAVAGLEVYGRFGLIRSVAVAPEFRSLGIARRLVGELLDRARGDGIQAVYLLTLTAREYFARLGFSVVDRAQAPAEIQASEEFASICPVSSAFMEKRM